MTPTELAVELDRIATQLRNAERECGALTKKRKNSQYLADAFDNLKKGGKFLDKAIAAMLRR